MVTNLSPWFVYKSYKCLHNRVNVPLKWLKCKVRKIKACYFYKLAICYNAPTIFIINLLINSWYYPLDAIKWIVYYRYSYIEDQTPHNVKRSKGLTTLYVSAWSLGSELFC